MAAGWTAAGAGLKWGHESATDVLAMGTEHNWTEAMHSLHWEEELGKKYETPHT